MEVATASGRQPQADGVACTNGRGATARGAFYSKFLVTVIIDRTRALPKRLTDVHSAESFEQLCLALLQEELGADTRPTSLKAFFQLDEDWVLVENNAEPIQAVLARFPESRSLRFEAFTNELSALELKPLRRPPKRNLFLSATIFVVKTVLAYEVLASVADMALRAVGLKPNKRGDNDDEQTAFDDVLRALKRMDSEELERLNNRAQNELSRMEESPQDRTHRARSTLSSRLGPAPPPEERLGGRPSSATAAPPNPTPAPSGAGQEQRGPAAGGEAAATAGAKPGVGAAAGAVGPAAGMGQAAGGGGGSSGLQQRGSRAQLRQKLEGPGAQEALQDIIDAGAAPARKGLGRG